MCLTSTVEERLLWGLGGRGPTCHHARTRAGLGPWGLTHCPDMPAPPCVSESTHSPQLLGQADQEKRSSAAP